MASSDFWRKRAVEFKGSRPRGGISAFLDDIPNSPTHGQWEIIGGTLAPAFEALARRAAEGIASEKTTDLLKAWIERLVQEGFGTKSISTGEVFMIGDIYEASESLCRMLESRALQSEFEERRHMHQMTRLISDRLYEKRSPSTGQVTDQEVPIREDRRSLIDRFIAKVLEDTGKKINRTAIWRGAGYRDATDFERFQRNDKRASKTATANFFRILRMEPESFIKLLSKRKSKR